MSSGVTYAIATEEDDDALLTFAEACAKTPTAGGNDDDEIDMDLDDGFSPSFGPKPDGPPRRCLWVIFPVLVVSLVAAVAGFFTGKGGEPKNIFHGIPKAAVVPGLSPPKGAVPKHTIRAVNHYPHDQSAFTEGLEYSNGYLYESTGLFGHSSLRKVNILDGNAEMKYEFKDKNLFGEGMTLHKDHHIFMLTWRAGRGFIFDQKNFTLVKEWRYKGQGWGLTMDDDKNEVYMSDGTPQIRVLEPENLTILRWIDVTLESKPVKDINELEWVCGELWANIWKKKEIIRIDPVTGIVKSIVDSSKLPLPMDVTPDQDVLNGIAFDKHTPRLYLTGKRWKKVYEVQVEDSNFNFTCSV